MKHFDPVGEHSDWQTECVARGAIWLAKNPGAERPKDYWTGKRPSRKFRRHLRDRLGGKCSYTVLPEANGQMDHFEPWANLRGTANEARAYAWDNFRYAAGWVNQAKSSTPLPDPYTVGDDWFEVRLPDLSLKSTAAVPAAEAHLAKNALKILGTDDRAVDARAAWFDGYRGRGVTFPGLEKNAPMIAEALRRQPEFLHSEDAHRLGLAVAVGKP